MDDLSLVERIKQGDRAAFNELYTQHYPSLRSYARLLVDEKEAEDVVQDVFFTIWIHRDALDNSLSIRGYLLRAVYHTALNVIKRKGLQSAYETTHKEEIEEMGRRYYYDPEASEIVRRLYLRDLRADLQAAIDSLPPRCKEVFSLSYLYDLSGKEISRRLGISLSTVENHIYNALKLLREKLKSHKNDFPAL